jgi:hypothetical protein
VVLGGLFTFASAYSTCSDRHTDVTRAQTRLQRECDILAELTPRIAALTLRYAPQLNGLVRTADLARVRLNEHRSPADMARAYGYLQRMLQQMIDTLDDHPRVAKLPAYMDARAAFAEQTRKVAQVVDQYNNAAIMLNAALAHPTSTLWKNMMGFGTVELFEVRAASNATKRAGTPVRVRAGGG